MGVGTPQDFTIEHIGQNYIKGVFGITGYFFRPVNPVYSLTDY